MFLWVMKKILKFETYTHEEARTMDRFKSVYETPTIRRIDPSKCVSGWGGNA